MSTAYTSNTSPLAIAQWLRARTSVVVLTHAKPDGDALGTSLALARALSHSKIKAEVWLLGPVPDWSAHFIGDTVVHKLSADNLQLPSTQPDGVIVCDTGSWSQIDSLRSWLQPRHLDTVVIDHHLSGDPEMSLRRYVDTRAASAAHACSGIIDALLNLAPNAPYPIEIAQPLFLGTATDTGWLRFSNVTSDTLRFMARLLDSGVDHPAIYERIEQQQKPSRPQLLGQMLTSLEYVLQGRVGIMSISDARLRELGAVGEDTGGFAEPVLSVAGVRVVATLTEMPVQPDGKPLVKVSLRSKPGPAAVDVAAIAQKLGGGGHARAAGIKLRENLASAKATLIHALS